MSPWTPLAPGDGPDVRRTCAEGNDYDWGSFTSAQVRETQRRLDERCTKLAEVMSALAASQADLSRVEAERDYARAQLDDAIAAFRAEKEKS